MIKLIKQSLFICTALAIALPSIPVDAYSASNAAWSVNTGSSTVYFGSIKKNKVGEVHEFTGVSGTVSADGKVEVAIDLGSVNTNIAIRDKRMLRHVLDAGVPAMLSASVDMDALNKIGVGSTGTLPVEGTLTLGAIEVPVNTDFFIVHLSAKKVIATTQSMIMLSTDKAGLTNGVDELMKLAKLPSITRVSPVTIRLVLEK